MHNILNLSLKNSSFYFFASVIDFVIFLKVLVIVSLSSFIFSGVFSEIALLALF
ncbi:hypothetical protein AIOGIFDO_00104 [Candidatus Methanoperedenaceae archaeon GB37]|nr:hypothetical protein AIOGIFDO_00104 [Candidatus Methanoperedenaceae archaeon GB37]